MTCTVGHFYRLFHLGLACRPTDSSIVLLLALFFRETPILAGGIGVARVVVGAVFCCLFLFWSNCESVLLTAKRLG